jgi:4-amino-4-deoxy-L-arabinose transferase-like glycosyltransferase
LISFTLSTGEQENMKRTYWNDILIYLGLILIIAPPFFIGIDKFVTTDEPTWLRNGGNFYYALGQRDFQKTYSSIYIHPGITTDEIVASVLLVVFPEYRGIGTYFPGDAEQEKFLLQHGIHPLNILVYARSVQVGIILIALLILFYLFRRLIGTQFAFICILLISYDPCYLGNARLLNHEAMMSIFMLLSILFWVVYLFKDGKAIFLILSGAFAAIACLSKSPAIFLFPFTLVILGIRVIIDWRARKKPLIKLLGIAAIKFLCWSSIFNFVHMALWPARWVEPLGTLKLLLFDTLGLSTLQLLPVGVQEAPHFPWVNAKDLSWELSMLIWKTTPVIWIGVILAFVLFLSHIKNRKNNKYLNLIFLLSGLVALGFLFVYGSGILSKTSVRIHYLLSVFLCLDVIAAIGWFLAAVWLDARLLRGRAYVRYVLFLIILLSQTISSLSFYPYYYTYYNPIQEALKPGRQHPVDNYSEVLEQAAVYLSNKPAADQLRVLSWFATGPFSYYFPGIADSIIPSAGDDQDVLENLREYDYLVIYYDRQLRKNDPPHLLAALQEVVPEHVIWYHGVEYVRIYRVKDLPEEVFIIYGQ